MYDNFGSVGVDPREMAQRVMEIRKQIAKEFIEDLQDIEEENNILFRETLAVSLDRLSLGGEEDSDTVSDLTSLDASSVSVDDFTAVGRTGDIFWDEKFAAMAAFLEANQRLPMVGNGGEEVTLARWYAAQKSVIKNKKLPENDTGLRKKAALDSLLLNVSLMEQTGVYRTDAPDAPPSSSSDIPPKDEPNVGTGSNEEEAGEGGGAPKEAVDLLTRCLEATAEKEKTNNDDDDDNDDECAT